MPEYDTCIALESGAVGQSGASIVLEHEMGRGEAGTVVLRAGQSNLCASHGAFGALMVNGQLVGAADLSDSGSSIQQVVNEGDLVAAMAAMIPRGNGIICVVLGDAEIILDLCGSADAR